MRENKGMLKQSAITFHVASKRLECLAKNIFKTLFCKTRIGQTLYSFFDNERYDKEIASKSDTERMIIEHHNRKIQDKREEKLLKSYGQFLSEDALDDLKHKDDSLMQTARRFVDLYDNMNNDSPRSNLDENESFNDDDFTM